MPWKIITTPEYRTWAGSLNANDERALLQRLELLRMDGPQARRPHFATLTGSRYNNLKEIIVTKPALRVIFIFDPEQQAVLLLGGDKSTDYRNWYDIHLPLAEDIYERYLAATHDSRFKYEDG
ncbi:MAG: type II toxin-antitoxin system RelE/ParE family toxin [Actinomycetota bacterium]